MQGIPSGHEKVASVGAERAATTTTTTTTAAATHGKLGSSKRVLPLPLQRRVQRDLIEEEPTGLKKGELKYREDNRVFYNASEKSQTCNMSFAFLRATRRKAPLSVNKKRVSSNSM